MTTEKVLEVVAYYRRCLEQFDIAKEKFEYYGSPNSEEIAKHCHAMLDDIEQFVREGRTEKAHRHLGFVQGCLWAIGVYTIEELKNHNRSHP